MTFRPILLLLFLTINLTKVVLGQTHDSDEQLNKYLLHLKDFKVDSIVIVKSGCVGCDVINFNSSKHVEDEQSIYVLTKQSGIFLLAIFNDADSAKYINIDTCTLFKFINQNENILQNQKSFYKKEISKIKSKSGFYPPILIHHSFEELTINLSFFNYNFEVNDDDKDHFGFKCDNTKWFIITKNIIKRVYNYSKQ